MMGELHIHQHQDLTNIQHLLILLPQYIHQLIHIQLKQGQLYHHRKNLISIKHSIKIVTLHHYIIILKNYKISIL